MGKAPPKELLPPNRVVFSFRDAAGHTGLSVYSVGLLVRDGTLKTTKIGSHSKITRASLAAFLDSVAADPSKPEAA